ncbi:hypothetical protein NDU88_001783 [Pleurodeles waltl]|uniref:Uncharacterized protein n=1 Tax=Pleurodeles waltl TaxID=8319 RepID=A0AAV7UVP0_PLEWA|nr:hypothetical protein NDU88_001783 [Pleurodeles waltl]
MHTSAAHHTHGRIDLLFMPAMDVPRVAGEEILPHGVSDHAPLLVQPDGTGTAQRPVWRLNAWHLQDGDYVETLREELTHYFMNNLWSVPSSGSIWTACKATLSGHAKHLLQVQECVKSQQVADLKSQALCLEMQLSYTTNASITRHLGLIREEIHHLTLETAKHMWHASTARVYGWGDKSRKLIHWLATQPLAGRVVPEIVNDSGPTSQTPQDIAQSFATYYTRLYAEHARPQLEREVPLLRDLFFPRISAAERHDLDEPIALEEVRAAISALASDKTPCLGRFPEELYSKCSDILAPQLLRMYKEAEQAGSFPPGLDQATIVVIPKTHPTSMHCSTYCPISQDSVYDIGYQVEKGAAFSGPPRPLWFHADYKYEALP